jgi:hypothetical protein
MFSSKMFEDKTVEAEIARESSRLGEPDTKYLCAQSA